MSQATGGGGIMHLRFQPADFAGQFYANVMAVVSDSLWSMRVQMRIPVSTVTEKEGGEKTD